MYNRQFKVKLSIIRAGLSSLWVPCQRPSGALLSICHCQAYCFSSLNNLGVWSGEGLCPLPREFLNFLYQNSGFYAFPDILIDSVTVTANRCRATGRSGIGDVNRCPTLGTGCRRRPLSTSASSLRCQMVIPSEESESGFTGSPSSSSVVVHPPWE